MTESEVLSLLTTLVLHEIVLVGVVGGHPPPAQGNC